MVQINSPTPYYVQIKDYVRQKILSGAFPENSRIPSERQLAAQFNVTRLTVAKALNELAQEGLIQSRVGKGRFVGSGKIDHELRTLTSFTQDIQARGQQPSSQVLKAVIESAGEEAAHALSILPGEAVMVLERVRLADLQPVALEASLIPAKYCPNLLENHDFSRESLYEVLGTDYNLHLVYAQQTIEARMPTPHECEALQIRHDTAILSIHRVTYTDQDRPIEFVRSAYRGDRYKLRAVLRKA